MKINIFTEIINRIERNKISTVEIADALYKTGVIDGIRILNPGHFVVGKVAYVCAYGESNWPIHDQIRNIEEDCVLFVDSIDCGNKAIFGDIVTKYLILYKKVRAIVVNGLLRDGHRLRKEDYPMWCTGVTPLGCFNKEVELKSNEIKIFNDRKKMFDGSIMVCDDSGITMIGKEHLNAKTLDRLEFIELQEDIWYYCIDTLKWDTFDTICLKKYLNENEVLPPAMREKILKYTNG